MVYTNALDLETKTISFKAYRLLFAVLWTQYSIMKYVKIVVSMLPVVGIFADYVFPTMVILTLFISFPYIIKKIRPIDVFFYFAGLLVVFLTMTFAQENAEFIKEDMGRILIQVLPLYFVGISYNHDEMKNDLYKLSLLSVILGFFYEYFFLSSVAEADYNMDAAYKILPSIMYMIYWALENKRIRDWAVVFLGVFLALAYGTRGVILAILIYIFAGLFFNFVSSQNAIKKILFFIVFGVLVYLFIGTNFLVTISMRLTGIFESLGFSTRIFDHMIGGEIGRSDGRQIFAHIISEKIMEKPITGYGIYSDRVFIGVYVHNIILELWCDFGVIFGTLLLAWFVFIPTRAYVLTKRRDIKDFILMFICMVFTRLMLSNSYLVEANLYLMLGLGVGLIRNIKAGKIE